MNITRIMMIVLIIGAILMALFMLTDLNDEFSLSRIDSYENVGFRQLNGSWWTMEDAFEMDIITMMCFNIIPLMVVIGVPICGYKALEDSFEEEDR